MPDCESTPQVVCPLYVCEGFLKPSAKPDPQNRAVLQKLIVFWLAYTSLESGPYLHAHLYVGIYVYISADIHDVLIHIYADKMPDMCRHYTFLKTSPVLTPDYFQYYFYLQHFSHLLMTIREGKVAH